MIRKMATLIPPPVSKKLVIRRTTTVWESWQLAARSQESKVEAGI